MKKIAFIILITSQLACFAQESPMDFQKVDNDFLLTKIAKTSPGTWSLSKDSNERHYGLTTNEFFKNFGNDRVGNIGSAYEISAEDKAGFNYTAIHALTHKNLNLTNKITELEDQLKSIEQETQRLTENNTSLMLMLEKIQKVEDLEHMVKEIEYRITNIEQQQEEK